MLSETRQSEKMPYDSTCYEVSKVIKFTEIENRMVGRGKEGLFNGYRASDLQMKMFWKSVSQPCEYTKHY